MDDDFEKRAADADARRRSLPESVRLVMDRDAHLFALLRAWICSGHVPARPVDMVTAGSLSDVQNAPIPVMRPGSVEDVLAYAVVALVANKAALVERIVARQMGTAPATS